MERKGCGTYSEPALSPIDPPDCTGKNLKGNLVGFEITEFVSQNAVQINERARPERGKRPTIDRMVMAIWSEESVIAQVRSLLGAKDEKKYIGGPFAEYIAVIHTDEPMLIRADVEKWLAGASFGPYRQLTSAYFLYSYEPGKGYPCQLLPFRGA